MQAVENEAAFEGIVFGDTGPPRMLTRIHSYQQTCVHASRLYLVFQCAIMTIEAPSLADRLRLSLLGLSLSRADERGLKARTNIFAVQT